ncbi:MAG TPA: phytochelatin synthase family protein, partial [Rugosibacter sp.]|nr:phytochelatin synthase family protein [Rugosibacter sp.]HQN47222.1 phytochelatin synthase family protein [Rugosibacter sp.]
MSKTKKNLLRVLLVISLVSASWSGWTVWNTALRAPSFNRLPVPQQLIAGDSAAGQQLFVGSGYTADYDSLMAHFVAQVRPAFCGVASSVVVLNALPAGPAMPAMNVMPVAQLTQQSFFDDAASQVRNEWRVTFGGTAIVKRVVAFNMSSSRQL